MGNYTQSVMNSLTAEYEVSEVLAHFNSAYILDVIQEKINNRFIPTMVLSSTNPNIIISFEDNFKRCFAMYPEDAENIRSVREETYREVIDIICNNYGITFKYTEGIEPYTYAYFMYDFFVCNYAKYIASFFAQYIYTNKDALYNALNLEAYKKSKDASTQYGKKVYEDSKLAVISSNIVLVINAIRTFDITKELIFSTIFGTKEIVELMSSAVNTPYDIFKTLFYSAPVDYQPILFTNVRLELQKLAVREDGIDYL